MDSSTTTSDDDLLDEVTRKVDFGDFFTMDDVSKKMKMKELLPVLATWLCKTIEHFYFVGLHLNVPYHKLMQWEVEDLGLVDKYLNILEWSSDQMGDEFPLCFKHIMDKIDCTGAFNRFVTTHPNFTFFKGRRFYHFDVQPESVLMQLFLELALYGQYNNPGIDVLISSCFGLQRESCSQSVGLDLFKMIIEGYVKFPLPTFISKLKSVMFDVNMMEHYEYVISNLDYIHLWDLFTSDTIHQDIF